MAKWYILILFFVFLILPVGAVTTTIDFKERYYDSAGVAHDFNNGNLVQYPLYTWLETPDNYWITRYNDTIYLPKKSWIEYQFYPERIVPRYRIDNFSQISSLVTKVNGSVWYLSVPFSAYRYVSITDDLIDFGAFKRTTKVIASDSNTSCGLDCPDYQMIPKVINNNIRLYFNPQNFSNVVYPLFLTENTVIVDNATFWSSQDCGDGYWSAYGGGSCATPLSDIIHQNLLLYLDLESTAGTEEQGINKYGRFPNSTITSTFYGNPSVNYVSGEKWGNGLHFDGTNDYLFAQNTFHFTGSYFVFSKTNISTSSASLRQLSKRDGSSNGFIVNIMNYPAAGQMRYYSGSGNDIDALTSNATNLNNGVWRNIGYGLMGTEQRINVDDAFDSNRTRVSGSTTNVSLYFGQSGASAEWFNGSMDEIVIVNSSDQIFSNSMYRTAWNKSFLSITATPGSQIDAVKFNIYNINTQNNVANISARQTGNATWTVINTTYVNDTWINQTFWASTDFVVNFTGNGSSRSFVISMTYDESPLSPPVTAEITGYVNNTLGVFVDGALVTINGASALSRETYLRNNTDLCNFNHTSMMCDGSRQSGVNYTASSELQLIVFAHANAVNTTADVVVNIDGTNVTYNTGRPLGGAEQSYKSAVIIVPIYSNYTVYFANYHHYEWREYLHVHGYYNLTSANGTQTVLARQIGYENFTGTLNVITNMTYNITLSEKETISEATAIDYSLVGSIIGGLLAFVLLRRKRKDDDYKYKRE